MKMIASLLLAAFLAPAAFANNDCNGLGHDSNGGCNTEPVNQTCYVSDRYGNVWESNNMGVGSTVWAQYHAIKACRAESRAPRSCHPEGCQ